MARLVLYMWERYLDKNSTEAQVIEERALTPAHKVCPAHTKSLMAVADSFELSSAQRRGSQSMEQILGHAKTLEKQVKHKLTRLNSFERREVSKGFGADLRRLGDLFDKDPSVRIKSGQLDGGFDAHQYAIQAQEDGLKLREAADEFDKLFGRPAIH